MLPIFLKGKMFMSYQTIMQRIQSLQAFGSRPGLKRIGALMKRLGNPQDRLHVIHVAGTNGKGTTCELLSSVLSCAGYRTGLYLSPHVSDFCERMQINGEMISQNELAEVGARVFTEIEDMKSQGEIITEFEAVTAMAFLWYAEKSCDLVVLEVGLGGRLDATNVVQTPAVSVITSISLDHTKILGDTVEQIASEKCGIIKEGGVTVSYPNQRPGALKTIEAISEERKNRFVNASSVNLEKLNADLSGIDLLWNQTRLHLPFLGDHQVNNARTVLAVLEELRKKGYTVSGQSVQRGFEQAKFPARFEVLSKKPVVILDGAHNPDGTAALAAAVRQYLPAQKIIAVMGMLEDKDVDTAVQNLSGLFTDVVTVTPNSDRAMQADDLAKRWNHAGTPAEPAHGFDEALSKADQKLKAADAVLICGSLYLAGDLRRKALRLWNPTEI